MAKTPPWSDWSHHSGTQECKVKSLYAKVVRPSQESPPSLDLELEFESHREDKVSSSTPTRPLGPHHHSSLMPEGFTRDCPPSWMSAELRAIVWKILYCSVPMLEEVIENKELSLMSGVRG